MNLQVIKQKARDMASDKTWETVLTWAARILMPILLAAWGMMMSTLQDLHTSVGQHSNRLTAIEASRYTSDDARHDQGKLYDQLDGIKRQLAEMERRIPSRIEFETLNESIKDLRAEIRAARDKN